MLVLLVHHHHGRRSHESGPIPATEGVKSTAVLSSEAALLSRRATASRATRLDAWIVEPFTWSNTGPPGPCTDA